MPHSKKNGIQFHFISPAFFFPDRIRLKSFTLDLFKKEGYKVASVNYIFCTDAYLLALNQQYLNHNTFTDVITFELSKKNEAIVADIYISIERVKENSMLFKSGFLKELHRVIFHGTLHLCGYTDRTPFQKHEMRLKEDHYLSLYFVSRETKP